VSFLFYNRPLPHVIAFINYSHKYQRVRGRRLRRINIHTRHFIVDAAGFRLSILEQPSGGMTLRYAIVWPANKKALLRRGDKRQRE